MTTPPFTVDVIEQALEQGLAVITLMQLRDALQSGEVAILTQEDREKVLDLADSHGKWEGDADGDYLKARTLLQLPVEKST